MYILDMLDKQDARRRMLALLQRRHRLQTALRPSAIGRDFLLLLSFPAGTCTRSEYSIYGVVKGDDIYERIMSLKDVAIQFPRHSHLPPSSQHAFPVPCRWRHR